MADAPAKPKIYHITHLRNLPRILEARVLWSDAKRIELGLECDVVGMSHIKKRRLNEIEVNCHAGTHVGDYAPFYLCPRSVMLYILYRGNHPDLNYNEGQRPIIHLEADLAMVVAWANDNQLRWAFSDRNAGTYYCKFFADMSDLGQLNWAAINATDWRDSQVKENKQAEFLFETAFPWELVERIGVIDADVKRQVEAAIAEADHRPSVEVQSGWYY